MTGKIYVAGHKGLVGSSIWSLLSQRGGYHLIGRTHKELDLMDQLAVRHFFEGEKPDYVVLAAAYVGGIKANNTHRADFIFRNLQIQQNVIGECFRTNVKKLLFLGSSCIYPRDAEQPIKEESLLSSPLEYTNEPYAIAKIAGLKMCESFNTQYGTNYISLMPTNLYGPNDNFDLENGHVLPSMLRKFHLAKLLANGDRVRVAADLARRPYGGRHFADMDDMVHALAEMGICGDEVRLWGSGEALREFLWSEDLAQAALFLLENINVAELGNCHINIGTQKECTIAELAAIIAASVGFEGRIVFNGSLDGTMRKLTDCTKIHSLGWHHTVELNVGIDRLYKWYLSN